VVDDALRRTFDTASELYDRVRPEYPSELYDHLLAVTGLRAGDRVLEVGCGTGKATVALARRGLTVTAIELGPSLASVARRNLAAWPDVTVVDGNFEEHVVAEPFDAVVAATAWHWIDPATRERLAWQALRPGGHLAVWTATHVFPDGGDPIFDELQDVYDEIGERLPRGAPRPRPGELPSQRDVLEATGHFAVIGERSFDWETLHDAQGYIDLLSTFSGHIAMAEWQRDRLFRAVRERLAQRDDGVLRRHWGVVVAVARRCDTPQW
jgi:SAM-dependent methyltransferase